MEFKKGFWTGNDVAIELDKAENLALRQRGIVHKGNI